METEREKEEAILAKLRLLAEMRRVHEWAVFGQKEADELEETESEIDSETSDSPTD